MSVGTYIPPSMTSAFMMSGAATTVFTAPAMSFAAMSLPASTLPLTSINYTMAPVPDGEIMGHIDSSTSSFVPAELIPIPVTNDWHSGTARIFSASEEVVSGFYQGSEQSQTPETLYEKVYSPSGLVIRPSAGVDLESSARQAVNTEESIPNNRIILDVRHLQDQSEITPQVRLALQGIADESAITIAVRTKTAPYIEEIEPAVVRADPLNQVPMLAMGAQGAAVDLETVFALKENLALAARKVELFEDALQIARAIEDAEMKAKAISFIASEQAKGGIDSSQLFKEAIETAHSVQNASKKAIMLATIAGMQAKAGLFKEAIRTALGIEDLELDEEKDQTLLLIASEQTKAGLFEEAIKTVLIVEKCEDKIGRVLKSIATAQAKAGLLEAALRTARMMNPDIHNDEKAEALAFIAAAQARAGGDSLPVFTEAVEIARTTHETHRDWLLLDIASHMAGVGLDISLLFEGAIETNRNLQNSNFIIYYLSPLVSEQVKAGIDPSPLLKEALETARSIKNVFVKADILESIASTQAKAGIDSSPVFREAIKNASLIKQETDRADKLRTLIRGRAEEGFFEDAKEATSVMDAGRRARTLGIIATKQAEAGFLEESIKTARSMEVVRYEGAMNRTIDTAPYKASALSSIAVQQAKAGIDPAPLFEEAIETVLLMEDDINRKWELASIAIERARAGIDSRELFMQAIDGVSVMDSRDLRDAYAKAWSLVQAKAGFLREAIKTAQTIGDYEGERLALYNIISELARTSFAIQVAPLSFEEKKTIFAISSAPPVLEQLGRISTIEEIGGLAWEDEQAFAKMAEAATRMRNTIEVDEEETKALFKKYSTGLRQALKTGRTDVSVRYMALILSNLAARGENAAASILLEIAKSQPADANLFHLLYALTKLDSFKAKDLVLQAIGAGNLKDSQSWLLIRKLIEEKYLSPQLEEFYERQVAGLSGNAKSEKLAFLLKTTQQVIRELKVTPDVALLEYLLKDAQDIEGVEANIATAKEWKDRFDSMESKDDIVEYLSQDEGRALLYFIIYGGRTRFALVNNYDSEKFRMVLNVAKDLRIHERPLNEFLDSLPIPAKEEIKAHLLAGSFPLGGTYSREIRIDVSNAAQMASLETRTGQVFGKEELGVLLKLRIYMEEMAGTPLGYKLAASQGLADAAAVIREIEEARPDISQVVEDKLQKMWRKLGEKKVLEMSLYAALNNQANPASLKDLIKNLEVQRKALQSVVRQQYKGKSIDKLVRDERLAALEEKGKAKLMRYILQQMAGGSETEVEGRIFAEWEAHMDQVFQDFERMKDSEVGMTREKSVTIRWLDKKADLIECLRFADSAQNCFSSKNYRIGGHNIGSAEWIVRLWKDPLSFMFLIEDSPGNAIGFVHGSFGLYKGKPVVMLNGVYMEGKTDTATQSILNTIEKDFSRRLGARMQIVAARYGGTTNLGEGYSNERIEVERLRALMGHDGRPEAQIYDDLNVGVNVPGTTDEKVWHKEIP